MAKRSAVLVHGDVHQWNALEAKQGFKLVDPDGLLAEADTTWASSCARTRRSFWMATPPARALAGSALRP